MGQPAGSDHLQPRAHHHGEGQPGGLLQRRGGDHEEAARGLRERHGGRQCKPSPPSLPAPAVCGHRESQSGDQCVTTGIGPHPSHPHRVEKPTTSPFTPSSMSFLSQQQANLIPGLNLSALGIFSTGLSMLPSTPGARGAAAVTPYHPFGVSVRYSWCLECPARAVGFGWTL